MRVESRPRQHRGPGEKAAEGSGEGRPWTVGFSSPHSCASRATLRSQHSGKGVEEPEAQLKCNHNKQTRISVSPQSVPLN